MHDKKGQAALEVIVIVVVLLGLLLATVLIMTQRNIQVNNLYAIERDRLKCDSIAAILISFSSNRGYSETKLDLLEKSVYIERGGIFVGEASCQYSGTTLKETADNVFVQDTTGFSLETGKEHKIRTTETGVVFCDKVETWC